eukprot:scaffold17643_cov36-Phaeocystis_antarctica.AAC.1
MGVPCGRRTCGRYYHYYYYYYYYYYYTLWSSYIRPLGAGGTPATWLGSGLGLGLGMGLGLGLGLGLGSKARPKRVSSRPQPPLTRTPRPARDPVC